MKLTIVTPSFNSEKYIEQTIKSVISQAGDFEIEYIIIDGGSTDKTVGIISEYAEKVKNGTYNKQCLAVTLSWSSEKDRGMYDAINKGFAKATGDIYAWINADDFYHENAFKLVIKTFSTFLDIDWIKGISDFVDENSKIIKTGKCYTHRRDWLGLGIYGRNAYHITQDSVFWRKSLWEKAGPIDQDLNYAGDYELWIKMSHYSALWSINAPVSHFRKRIGQLSKDVSRYKSEQQKIMPQTRFSHFFIRSFFALESRFRKFESLFIALYPLFFKSHENYLTLESNNLVKKKMNSYTLN